MTSPAALDYLLDHPEARPEPVRPPSPVQLLGLGVAEAVEACALVQARKNLGAHYTPTEWAKAIAARGLQPLMCWPEAMQCPACAPSVEAFELPGRERRAGS